MRLGSSVRAFCKNVYRWPSGLCGHGTVAPQRCTRNLRVHPRATRWHAIQRARTAAEATARLKRGPYKPSAFGNLSQFATCSFTRLGVTQ